MGSTEAKLISEQNQAPNILNKKGIIDTETIRNFHGLRELPLCCDLTSDKRIDAKLHKLSIELQAEIDEIMQYGFQPYAMKDWMTKDVLAEILNVDPNSLRDEKFRKLKLDFRDPRSWGEILKGSGEFYQAWKAGNYAGLHEVFFSAFLNRVLTEAEEYLHSSFTRNHPKIRVYTKEVIDFLDNKFDPDENHGRIVADTSAVTEIYAATQNAKLQSFMLYLTHDLSFEEARELVKNSTTLITKKGLLGIVLII